MRSEKTMSLLTMVGSMDGPEHWRTAVEKPSYYACVKQKKHLKAKEDNTNHDNLSNVLKSTVCNAAILNCVAHKS